MTVTLHYEPPTRTFRVMFNDGETVDVTAAQDDSRMREWVLKQHYGAKVPDGQGVAAVVRLDEPGADGRLV